MSIGFHNVCGTNVKIINNKNALFNFSNQKNDAYIFSQLPLEPYVKFSVRISTTQNTVNNNDFIVGVTSIDPNTIKPSQLPSDFHEFADSEQYTDVFEVSNILIPNNVIEITLYYTTDGAFIMEAPCKEMPFLVGYIECSQSIWLFIKGTENCKEIEYLNSKSMLPNYLTDLYHISHSCNTHCNNDDDKSNGTSPPKKYMVIVAATNQGENEIFNESGNDNNNIVINQPMAGNLMSTPRVSGLGLDATIPDRRRRKSSNELSFIINSDTPRIDVNIHEDNIFKQQPLSNNHYTVNPGNILQNINDKCVICFGNKKEHACYPCGHACFCSQCVGLFKGFGNICPICGIEIRDIIKIYF
uniref:RING-type domain-containing protein n=1 Tax=Parastrongyloides trichosuri TaxID=131310 RepID=A0A0N4ZFQ9_PARTI